MQNIGFFWTCFIVLTLSLQAQNESAPPTNGSSDYNNGYSIEESAPSEMPQAVRGTVAIAANPRIEELRQAHINSTATQKGYRVQIFQNTNRDIVRDEQARFIQLYLNLGVRTYESYAPPLFTLRIGDFTDRFVAYGICQQLKSDFPSAFLVEDEVN